MASFGTESWTLNEGTAKRLAAFERKILIRVFGGNKVNENWRKRCKEELLQLLGDLDILSFARISQLNWLGQVNRKDSKRKASQVSNNNPQGSRLRGRPKTDGVIVYKQILKMQNYKLERQVKNRPGMGKSIKEAKARTGME